MKPLPCSSSVVSNSLRFVFYESRSRHKSVATNGTYFDPVLVAESWLFTNVASRSLINPRHGHIQELIRSIQFLRSGRIIANVRTLQRQIRVNRERMLSAKGTHSARATVYSGRLFHRNRKPVCARRVFRGHTLRTWDSCPVVSSLGTKVSCARLERARRARTDRSNLGRVAA